jgi:hypothetical protein
MEDLSLVLTNDLIEALKNRYDHFIFSGIKLKSSQGKDWYHTEFNSSYTICLGLCEVAKADILKDLEKNDNLKDSYESRENI